MAVLGQLFCEQTPARSFPFMQRHSTPHLTSPIRFLSVPILCACLSACLGASGAIAWEPESKLVVAGKDSLPIAAAALTESSGLAFSHVDARCGWSHNDSGGKARLFAFGADGKYCGRIALRGVKANDWEDMASFVDEVPRLLIADVGDNDAERKSVSIYIFDEPNPQQRTTVAAYQHLVVRYAGGPQNCEAVAVDMANRRILLLEKSALVATLHQLDLPPRDAGESSQGKVVKIDALAIPVQRIAIPLATGMDFCPQTGDLWISNYLQAFCYPFHPRNGLAVRLREVPKMLDLPKLKQVEAIAIDDQGRVWVTSEGKPAKMQRVMVGD